MDIVYKNVSEINPCDHNPRINIESVPKVAASIQEFGFKIPIVINEQNVIICGHTRLIASQMLGMDKVPCIVAKDLTEAKQKAFRLVDNKTAEFSSWDFGKLREELASCSMFDMEGFGFDLSDLSVPDDSRNEGIDNDDKDYIVCPRCGGHIMKKEGGSDDQGC